MTPIEIRSLRDRLGLTQAEFAPLLGYALKDRVAELERNARKPGPAVALLLRAYDEGRLPVDWLHHDV